MGETTKIEWCDRTFNPWIGCQKVSGGCKNCYAEARDVRWKQGRWGQQAARVQTAKPNWQQPFKWDRDARAAGRRDKVFCASLADVFDLHDSIDPEWRAALFDMIRQTPNLDWLLLTKRPENIRPILQDAERRSANHLQRGWLHEWLNFSVPPANVWLGTSVEHQDAARERIPALLGVPAEVHFLSCEPLLQRVELREWIAHEPLMGGGKCMYCGQVAGAHIHSYEIRGGRQTVGVVGSSRIDWVIVGGESGGMARPFDIEWAEDLVEQCAEANVACFVKQLGAFPVAGMAGGVPARGFPLKDRKGGDIAEFPEHLRVRQFPEVR